MKTLTMKFGGTSVGSPEAIGNVIAIVQAELQRDQRVMVVVSAFAGVTDLLYETVREAVAGNKWNYLSASQKLRERHLEALTILTTTGPIRDEAQAAIEKLADQHAQLCQAVTILGDVTPRITDAIVTFGERWSSIIVAAALQHAGVNATAYDSGQFIRTDDRHGSATPIWGETETLIRDQLLPLLDQGVTPVLTGFMGMTADGHHTTLGRGGSDYSAAIYAAFTESDELVIWTDVDGVMTTDPRIDQRARVLPNVSYQEVGELAFYGAKVLHPKTVQPILVKNIPMRVRNTFNPQHPGTLIGPQNIPTATVIKAVTSVRHVSLLTVSGRGMLGVPGIAGRTFLATADVGANILMISQASSEQHFCFVVMNNKALEAREAIEAALVDEIEREDVDCVEVMPEVAIVTAVGAGMRGTPGVAGRIFTQMGEAGVNVIAIAQGASEVSVSFVIAEADIDQAVTALHDLALESIAAVNGSG
ncbi:MAG: aspartate kinase [Chloroflexi bacterium]|nr:aspartate kinase [Chloroflexota bacterium]